MNLSQRIRRPRGFTLIELLTVVFIIGVLIAILVPAVNNARNAAKNAKTASTLRAIETALEMFKSDNGSEFAATNGYPPSFAYPKIKGYPFNSWEGKFPFQGTSGSHPVAYGAQWLPAMLMGTDLRGFVRRSDVPPNLRNKPYEWYEQEPEGRTDPLARAPLYLNPEDVRLLKTGAVPGRSLAADTFFPNWDTMKDLPVIADPYDQPILYYAANTHGSEANMLSDRHRDDNDYSTEDGPPVYFHADNAGYTGTSSGGQVANGWDFSNRVRPLAGRGERLHHIQISGAGVTAADIDENRFTFAYEIHDQNAHSRMPDGATNWPLKAVRDNSYLLITAGVDGRYGTNDDVSNLPQFEEIE
jgi:type II secretion system protein G